MWLTGLGAPRHVGSSQTRARTCVPCIGRQTLNHCATREAPRCGFYTLVLLLANVPGQAFPNKRHTVPGTSCACNFSHADTTMPNAFTLPNFLTRTFQGVIIAWVRMLLQKTPKEVGDRDTIHCGIPLCFSAVLWALPLGGWALSSASLSFWRQDDIGSPWHHV